MYQGKYSGAAAPKTTKRQKRTPVGTIVFYSIYSALVLAFLIGIAVATNALRDWLTRYEASQPVHKCQEVFEELFKDPDWAALYEMAGCEDTAYEGKEAYAAYMQQIDPGKLTYLETSAGLSGGKKYIVKYQDEKIATFTLTSEPVKEPDIPVWELSKLEIFFTREQNVTVEKLPEHTVYINGVALSDRHTIRTLETTAESYLPEGIHGYRLAVQQLDGLLTEPEVTVKDAEGNPVPVTKDPDTGIYRLAELEMNANTEEEQLALNALQAYAKYMIRANGIEAVQGCFDTGSAIYDAIRKYEAWTMQSYNSYTFTEAAFGDYYRYSSSLFSIRVTMDLNVKRNNGSIKTYPLDTTLFFEKKADGKYMAINMTNAETQKIIEKVRLTFMDGDTILSEYMIEADAAFLTLPEVTAPEGKVLEGWVIKTKDSDGKVTLTVMFHPTESGTVALPAGTNLMPMTLFAHYTEVTE